RALPSDALDRSAHHDLRAAFPNEIAASFPHLAGAQPRITESVDQGLGDLAAPLSEQGVTDGAAQGQIADPLRRPVRRKLLSGNPPDLLGVSLEEDLEETLAEPVRDPLLEVLLDRIRVELGQKKTAEHTERRGGPQARERVDRLKRIVKEVAVIVDAREPRPRHELVPEDFLPDLVDQRDFGEKAMAAEIESVPVVGHRPRDPADDVVLLKDE